MFHVSEGCSSDRLDDSVTGLQAFSSPLHPQPVARSPLSGADHDAIVAAAVEVAGRIAGDAERHDRDGTFSHESVSAVWATGLGNLTVPASLGGVGAGLATTARAVEEIAKGDAATALVLVMHLIHIQLVTTNLDGIPDAVRGPVIASSLEGPALINALRVEPELGTPSRGGVPATRAVRATGADGEAVYRVTGRKIFSTGSYGLRWMIVWAATADDDPDGVRSGSFLVPADAPGVSIVETLGPPRHACLGEPRRRVRRGRDPGRQRRGTCGGPGRTAPLGSDPLLIGWMNVLLISVYHGAALAARGLAGRLPERAHADEPRRAARDAAAHAARRRRDRGAAVRRLRAGRGRSPPTSTRRRDVGQAAAATVVARQDDRHRQRRSARSKWASA